MLLNTPLCDFGWKAPFFTLSTAMGQQSYRLEDLMGQKGLLLMFVCNHCPYVMAVADRLRQDALALVGFGVGVAAIMSNNFHAYPADKPENMQVFAKQHNWNFPYLVDEDQAVAKAYNAICTPDFFGFNAQDELQYRGRLDDSHMQDKPNRKRELVEAMQQIAETGRGPEQQSPSMGCSIKWR